MDQDHVLQHFRDTDALLEGHFLLSSGLHSPQYLQCALALQYPADAAKFGRAIAEQLLNSPPYQGGVAAASADGLVLSSSSEAPAVLGGMPTASADGELLPAGQPEAIDTVASPAIGGLIIGYAVAQALNKRFIWTERQDGKMTLRRGFTLRPGERILVVEDVITTGGSTRECIAALEANGGKVVAAASIIDRSNGKADVGVPRITLAAMDVPSYEGSACPMCAEGGEPYKPGSRTTAAS